MAQAFDVHRDSSRFPKLAGKRPIVAELLAQGINLLEISAGSAALQSATGCSRCCRRLVELPAVDLLNSFGRLP